MMNQVYKTLPDDRPITSICVVEDVEKCPKGYVVVSRTHDQDSDADLWRESNFFGKKLTRYICLSKTEGTPDYIVQSIAIVNEKDSPPQGFSSLVKTFDTSQKAWRKKQLCYKFAHVSNSATAVTDIIVLSKLKKAPEEFTLSGEINGMTLCYKMGNSRKFNNAPVYPPVPYSLNPAGRGAHPTYQNIAPAPPTRSPLIQNGNHVLGTQSPHDYELLIPLTPARPAPKPPSTLYATMSGYNGLDGVPFQLNPKWSWASSADIAKGLSVVRPKSKMQIDDEFAYDFRTERTT